MKLDFPEYAFRMREGEKGAEIFDVARRKFVALTPEEWVRQHALHFLVHEKKMPLGRINVEYFVTGLNKPRRADIVVFDQCANPLLIVECKAPEVKITQAGFDQIARYNIAIKANYLFVTNGLNHFFCRIDFIGQSYRFLPEIPDYQTLCEA